MLVSKQQGFTLIEILIAIVILSFITIGIVTITDNSILTKDRTTQMNADNLQIETAMSRFEWDFSQIYSPMYFSQPMNFNQLLYGGGAQGANNGAANNGFVDPNQAGGFGGGGFTQGGDPFQGGSFGGVDPNMSQNPALAAYVENLTLRMQTNEHFQNVSKEGLPIPRFYAPEKTIFEFFTSSNRRKVENTKQSHFGWVRYTLIPQEDKPEEDQNITTKIAEIPKGLKSLARYYTADDPYSNKRINPDASIDGEKIKASVLLEHVESLEFQYWNLQARRWETSIKAIQNGESLLHGVRIKIAWYDSQGIKRTTDRIFRTHWPISTPVDNNGAAPPATTQGANSGQQSGVQSGEEDE